MTNIAINGLGRIGRTTLNIVMDNHFGSCAPLMPHRRAAAAFEQALALSPRRDAQLVVYPRQAGLERTRGGGSRLGGVDTYASRQGS